jgi:hypothetical protein
MTKGLGVDSKKRQRRSSRQSKSGKAWGCATASALRYAFVFDLGAL